MFSSLKEAIVLSLYFKFIIYQTRRSKLVISLALRKRYVLSFLLEKSVKLMKVNAPCSNLLAAKSQMLPEIYTYHHKR